MPARRNWMTGLILLSFLAVFAAELWFQFQLSGMGMRIDPRVLFTLGANYSPAFAAGEYWRVFSSCFLHVDLIHLAMNSLAFYYFGPLLERSFGPFKLLLAFVLTGMLGSLTTNLMHWQDAQYISAGASGGLYGLFGVIFVVGKRNRRNLPESFQTWLNQNFLLLVIFSFAPFIDMWGHFGGLATGMLLGLLFLSGKSFAPFEQAEAVEQPEVEQEASTEASEDQQPPPPPANSF